MIDPSRKSILVVDDDPETAQMLAVLLELKGYQVTKVHGTAQAIKAINTGEIDLVFLDIMLPDISGLEFCVMCVAIRYSSICPSLCYQPGRARKTFAKGWKPEPINI